MKGRALLVVPLGSGTWLPSPFFFLFFPSSDSSLLMGTGGGGGFVDPKWALFCFLFFFLPSFSEVGSRVGAGPKTETRHVHKAIDADMIELHFDTFR